MSKLPHTRAFIVAGIALIALVTANLLPPPPTRAGAMTPTITVFLPGVMKGNSGPTPPPTPTATPPTGVCDCSGDIHNLDGDADGEACESLP